MPDFAFLGDTLAQLLAVTPTTVALFGLSVAAGFVLAVGLATMRAAGGLAAACSRVYVFVFRGSPLLIQLFLVYYGLGQFPVVRHSLLWPVLRQPFWCAVVALALCTAGYTAEILRGGLLAVPPGQIEAARASGMSGSLLLRRIIAPIALRAALPAYSTEVVLMVKSTALASLVTVWEITGTAQRIIAHTYRTMEVFLCAAAIYLTLNFIILRLLGLLERALSAHERAAPATPAAPLPGTTAAAPAR